MSAYGQLGGSGIATAVFVLALCGLGLVGLYFLAEWVFRVRGEEDEGKKDAKGFALCCLNR